MGQVVVLVYKKHVSISMVMMMIMATVKRLMLEKTRALQIYPTPPTYPDCSASASFPAELSISERKEPLRLNNQVVIVILR